MNFTKKVEFVNKLLADNDEWIARYKNYAETIIENQQKHIDARKKFRVNPPIHLYSSITKLLDINVLKYDLRFLGQSIATIIVKNDIVKITTGKTKDASNLKYFGINAPLKNENWDSHKAKKFRSEFNKCKSIKGHSKEHKIESGLLSDFHIKTKSKKSLSNIQPVLIANTYFQMATPLKASGSETHYSSSYGGGIDILARVKHKDNSVKLCVMELKDEYKNSEPPKKAMNQAVEYATFIANLLRSESGNNWYNIFGFSGDVPKVLTIDVSIVMPVPHGNKPQKIEIENIEIKENTFIVLHTLYFIEHLKHIDGYSFEFEGSLKEVMMK